MRVAKFDKDGKFITDWGSEAEGSEEPGSERVEHRAQHRDQQGPPPLRRRPRAPPHAGLRRERQVPRHVQHRASHSSPYAPHHHRPTSSSGSPTAAPADHQVRPERQLPVRLGSPGGRPGQFTGRTSSRSTRKATSTSPRSSTAASRSSSRRPGPIPPR